MDPAERITAYFEACGRGTAGDIASHFTPDAVIYDTNIRPFRGAEAIGDMWVRVRERWGDATWHVDSLIAGEGDNGEDVAAIEWSMRGTDPDRSQAFVFRGSEHYAFEGSLIAEIRQYWTFDPAVLDTGLIDYDYDSHNGADAPADDGDGDEGTGSGGAR
jgi:hypothetical protein